MKAWRAHGLDEPLDVLRLDEIDPPTAPIDGAVVSVEAVGLGFPDLLQCRGQYQVKPALPFTAGTEVCGSIVEVGAQSAGLQVGDRVAAATPGGLAEQVAVRARDLVRVPQALDPPRVVAMLGNYTTTWHALHDRAALQPGEWVLVHGGAGGAGSSAIELGRAAGARVIATAHRSDKLDVCRRLGAELLIDNDDENLVEIIREHTDGAGVDVVYDPVGGALFDQSRRVVAWAGRYLVIGFASGTIPAAPLNHVLLKGYSIVGVHWGAALKRDPTAMQRAFDSVADLCQSGVIDPVLDGPSMPMEDAAQGLAKLASRQSVGKVIVDPRR